MIVITGHFVLSAPVSAEMRKAAADMMKASNAEAGCNHYAFAEDLSNPNILWVSEEWTDDAALKAHFQAPQWLRPRCTAGRDLGRRQPALTQKMYGAADQRRVPVGASMARRAVTSAPKRRSRNA